MKTAIFLGAGASKEFGYPLTAELLPRIIARLNDGILFNGANTHQANLSDRKWFGRHLRSLFPGLEDLIGSIKAESKLGVGVTDALTLVDRALLHSEARAGMPPEELTRFRRLLERAIYEALLRKNQRKEKERRQSLANFATWLKPLSPAGILTTNYDTAIDRTVFGYVTGKVSDDSSDRVANHVDLGFSWRRVSTGKLVPRPSSPKWQLFKLHGSVNWLQCCLCGQIYVNTRTTVGPNAFANKLDQWNTCHCNEWARLRLHLVTPSFIRQTHDAQLLQIWQSALELLRTADRWIIIGYSLPPEDIAIRSLLLRAWEGHERATKPTVTVVQRDNPDTKAAYQAFFPRKNLRYRCDGLGQFLQQELES